MKKITILLSVITLASCSTSRLGEQKSLGLNVTHTITADVETTVTPQGREDDSADDPAIWINEDDATLSLIFGTDKKGGIGSYKLNGEEVNYYKVGKINNVDIRQNVMMNGEKISVIAGSNRTNMNIVIGIIQKNGSVDFQHIADTPELLDKEVYGFCLGYSKNKLQAIINSKSGHIYIYDLNLENNQWRAKLSKELKVKTKPEGMIVDDELNFLYVGEEENSVWKIDLNDYSFQKVINSSESDNEFINYDIEGISIYKTENNQGYLIISSQGNNSYAVFERQGNNKYLKSFRIVDGDIDGVEETDGIDFSNHNFSNQFPKGIMVAQDGFNYDGNKKKSQNFKIIDWRKIENLLQ